MEFVSATALALGIALLAWTARSLTLSGAGAAALVGSVILTHCGWAGASVLGAFFLPSTAVGRLGRGRGEIRTATQVLANGGPAFLGSLGEPLAPGLGLWIVTASLAAAAADTWATALGTRSRREPVRFGTARRVPPGTSGGVSLLGTFGALFGAGIVAGTGALVLRQPDLFWTATGIGFGGMFLDSALGAWVQGRYRCPRCDASTEHRKHECGTPTVRETGWKWLDNNGVNLLTTLAAAGAGAAAWWIRG
jgi:uncharacterized protein (TIGR00297 family)